MTQVLADLERIQKLAAIARRQLRDARQLCPHCHRGLRPQIEDLQRTLERLSIAAGETRDRETARVYGVGEPDYDQLKADLRQAVVEGGELVQRGTCNGLPYRIYQTGTGHAVAIETRKGVRIESCKDLGHAEDTLRKITEAEAYDRMAQEVAARR